MQGIEFTHGRKFGKLRYDLYGWPISITKDGVNTISCLIRTCGLDKEKGFMVIGSVSGYADKIADFELEGIVEHLAIIINTNRVVEAECNLATWSAYHVPIYETNSREKTIRAVFLEQMSKF